MTTLLNLFKVPDLRRRIGITILFIFLYRFGSHIPISGVNLTALEALFNQGQGGVLGFLNLFSGGGLSRFSIFALGILPFINASIIMQLVTVLWPKMKELLEEGESGRKQISQYTRYLSIIIAFLQGIVMSVGFRAFVETDVPFWVFLFYAVISLVAGSAMVMWIGELISEHGIGNGASLLIFVGIIAQMPSYIKNTYVLVQGGASMVGVVILALVFIGMIVSIVYVQEAQRRVPVQYAKKIVGRKMYGGQNTYIPLKLAQGGVMPIIFASAVLQFPLMFLQYVQIPFFQNFFSFTNSSILDSKRRTTISSGTNCPDRRNGFAFSPVSLFLRASSRNQSPVEKVAMLKCSDSFFACVPFPAPGPPKKTTKPCL